MDLFSGSWGFEDGGYTGPGGKNQPAGVVHAGEFVINADATKRIGAPFLQMLNGMKGYAAGGLVGALTNETGKEIVADDAANYSLSFNQRAA